MLCFPFHINQCKYFNLLKHDSSQTLKFVRLKNLNGNIAGVAYQERQVLIISDAKLDESFPDGKFGISGFAALFWKNCDSLGSDIVLISEDISFRILSWESEPVNGLYKEINLCK